MYSDDSASFIADYKFDVSKLEPLVAAPHSPDNRKTARECSDVKIDRWGPGWGQCGGHHSAPQPPPCMTHITCTTTSATAGFPAIASAQALHAGA